MVNQRKLILQIRSTALVENNTKRLDFFSLSFQFWKNVTFVVICCESSSQFDIQMGEAGDFGRRFSFSL